MTTARESILIVDDDHDIRELLIEFLSRHDFNAVSVADGKQMLAILQQQIFNLIILDITLPGEDGFTLCRKLRADSDIPILMLTAVNEALDRVIGLELGADDYLAKPFEPRELLARIRAILRRKPIEIANQTISVTANEAQQKEQLRFGNWLLEIETRRLLLSATQQETPLSHGEYELLLAFLKHPQRVLSRDQLLTFTNNDEADSFDRSIDVQISRLRQKLADDPKNPNLIKTIRGAGYMFAETVEQV